MFSETCFDMLRASSLSPLSTNCCSSTVMIRQNPYIMGFVVFVHWLWKKQLQTSRVTLHTLNWQKRRGTKNRQYIYLGIHKMRSYALVFAAVVFVDMLSVAVVSGQCTKTYDGVIPDVFMIRHLRCDR
jgi:hypothetical protein